MSKAVFVFVFLIKCTLFSPFFLLNRYPFPTVFSTCSKKDLAASLEKGVGMCLYNMPEVKVLYGGQKCGNGYVEEGEECDCGEPEVRWRERPSSFLLLLNIPPSSV